MSDERQDGATPPDGGRMNHETMRRASELPVEGAPATETVAASGGLELPGRMGHGNTPDQQSDRADADRVPPVTAVSVEKMDRETREEE
jgi:hypothetical protein